MKGKTVFHAETRRRGEVPMRHEGLLRKDSLSREDAFFDVEEREEVPEGDEELLQIKS